MEAPVEPETTTDSGWPAWVEQWVMPYLQESALWPVLLALLGHIVVIIAPILTSVARGWRPAVVPLFALVLGSGWLVMTDYGRRKRPGVVTAVVLVTWALSGVVAYFAYITDVF